MRRSFKLAGFLLLTLSSSSFAVQPKQENGPLDRLAMTDPRLRPAPAIRPLEETGTGLAPGVQGAWSAFQQEHGAWRAFVDRRSGLLEIAEGPGIPWVPGPGNQLGRDDVAPHLAGAEVDLAALESIARAFFPRVAPLLGVDARSLRLSPGRSGEAGGYLWLVDFDVVQDGLPIEGARVVFRVNNGNLAQIGGENLPPPGARAPRETVSRKEALAILSNYIGGFSAADTFLDGGSLHLVPVALDDPGSGDGFAPGNGRGLAKVWQISFLRRGETGTWQARIDAVSGEVLELRDVNLYGRANGGVYGESPAGGETLLPMPFTDLSTGGFTDAAGEFVSGPPGAEATSSLSGSYVDIFDSCGNIYQNENAIGRIAFGMSGGTDCTTPGFGGPGNTHASRTQFYHLNRAKEIARGWLPGNSWLNSQLRANVNISNVCNATWNGVAVNFYRSGGGCGNTGELPAISLHEYGHGFDSNDGNNISPDLGTAEAYGDFTAALTLHSSCMGSGFRSTNCGGYGDACTSCTGVRDIDWAQHASGAPHTVANFTQPFCPGSFGYAGPCGREGHCESYVISEALWDFVERDLPSPGSPAAWRLMERLWHLSRSTATSAFTCDTSTATWTSNGCGAGSLWRVLRLADDDDGNLANGTPNSCHLFAAFDRHGLACASDPGANVCFSACTPPAAPAVTLTPGSDQIEVSWTAPDPGAVYDVYKSERGCDSGFIKIANDLSGSSFADTVVTEGLDYSYQVIAHPAGNEACGAAPSTCQSATPELPPCAVAPPTGVTAEANGLYAIDLSWDAVPGATAYVIYRSTASGGPYTEAGSVAAPDTAWTDAGLQEGTAYFYVVRAFAGCESAPSAQATATTDVCRSLPIYSNDFESGSGLSDWTAGVFPGGASPSEWRGIQACAAHSGDHVFRFGGSSCDGIYTEGQHTFAQPLGAEGIEIPVGVLATRLSFWHRWEFEPYYDGGSLSLSLDGSTYTTIPASAILSGAKYNNQIYPDCGPSGTVGRPVFSGFQTEFVNTVVNLDAACNLASGESNGCAGRRVWVAFVPVTDCIYEFSGWFIDDVEVSVCGPECAEPGAPAIGAASTPADHQIQVTWSQGSPAADGFNVYRAPGSCAAPGLFTKRAQQLSGSPFVDAPVSGGLTFSYRVTGVDETGFCESEPSGCVEATATGPCILLPTFLGLASAGNTAQTTCGVQLSWPAGSSSCGASLTYNVYRSTDPGFTPGPGNRIATGVTGTGYVDVGGLTDQTTYSYIVRAVDGGSGLEEANTVVRSAAPTGPTISGTILETFEGAQSGGGFDHPGWTHSALSGAADWTWSTAQSKSPTHSWLSPSQASTADRVLVSPTFRVQGSTTLSFWHTYEMEGIYDGGTLEISTNGGSTWTVLPDSAFTTGGFNQTLLNEGTNPIRGKRAWSGGTIGPMTQVTAGLSAWTGSDVKLRWHAGEDASTKYVGWYVDSVTIADIPVVSACQPETHPLDFHILTPCRLVDTRQPNGPQGGPALQPGAVRTFALAGSCNVPATARALAVNLTVTQPAAAGYLTVYADGPTAPLSSSITFAAGQTRSNNAILLLSNGSLRVLAGSGGTAHFVLDVTGYFE